jgi:hypothetical protein
LAGGDAGRGRGGGRFGACDGNSLADFESDGGSSDEVASVSRSAECLETGVEGPEVPGVELPELPGGFGYDRGLVGGGGRGGSLLVGAADGPVSKLSTSGISSSTGSLDTMSFQRSSLNNFPHVR